MRLALSGQATRGENMFESDAGWMPGCGCRPSLDDRCARFLELSVAGAQDLEAVLKHWLDAKAVEEEWLLRPELAEVGVECRHEGIALVRFPDGTAGWVCWACGLSKEKF
jgi:hypothetical protein